ncbi:hypothetical protein F441_12057 [Phytophthora nicotianae CJ01A1]|uniref:Uncharacterized protein n=2 Tax=Phytophthora nicotianae TaxID=4792 RepID=W2IRX4_PHYNI|nr:hypothetical protein L915_11806 [Phytophthora nicotianae]ETL36272.1 hypothetical protein L916_11731 [Phytophthora nicotianae]ETP12592.1 hypothetical protein F441_12057 [Phytophthora nicotianae CJ01A1]
MSELLQNYRAVSSSWPSKDPANGIDARLPRQLA